MRLNLSMIYLSNTSGALDIAIAGDASLEVLGGSEVDEIDRVIVEIIIPEAIRLKSISTLS